MIPLVPVVLTKVVVYLSLIYWTDMGSAETGERLRCGLTQINLCIYHRVSS